MLNEEYHKSTVEEDGVVPVGALGSLPQTEMGSFLFSGGIYRHGGHSITTKWTKSTRAPESMASRPADNFKGF